MTNETIRVQDVVPPAQPGAAAPGSQCPKESPKSQALSPDPESTTQTPEGDAPRSHPPPSNPEQCRLLIEMLKVVQGENVALRGVLFSCIAFCIALSYNLLRPEGLKHLQDNPMLWKYVRPAVFALWLLGTFATLLGLVRVMPMGRLHARIRTAAQWSAERVSRADYVGAVVHLNDWYEKSRSQMYDMRLPMRILMAAAVLYVTCLIILLGIALFV